MATIVFDVLPLAASAYVGCTKLFDVVTTAKALSADSQQLLLKLRIEKHRLQIWGEEWGLAQNPAHEASGQLETDELRLVHETFLVISRILGSYEGFEGRYGLKLLLDDPVFHFKATNEGLIAAELRKLQMVDSNSATNDGIGSSGQAVLLSGDAELRKKRQKETDFFKKCRWVVKDKDKMQSLISDLQDCNDNLYHLLSSSSRRRLRRGLAPALITTDSLTQLEALQQAFENTETIPDILALRQQNVQLGIDDNAAVVSGSPDNSLRIASTALSLNTHPGSSPASRQRATYHRPDNGEESVLVEWRFYAADTNDAARRLRLKRIDGLAKLLHAASKPKDLCVPNCVGYTLDGSSSRYGLVFRLSTFSQNQLTDIAGVSSLQDMIIATQKQVPALESRFKLALELALSLSFLHTSGWLHKNLRSDNILFLEPIPASRSGSATKLDNPQIVGFEYSRPQDNITMSEAIADQSNFKENMFRHPDSLGINRRSYCRGFDIYSLGVMLLEIGYWRPIQDFWLDLYATDPTQLRLALSGFHAPRLGPKTGSMYANLVKASLGGSISEVGALSDSESQNFFYWSVVSQLQRLVV